jgi:hypothetical protein
MLDRRPLFGRWGDGFDVDSADPRITRVALGVDNVCVVVR